MAVTQARWEAVPSSWRMGLTRAWIGAGAGAVMATQWGISDDDAELFMGELLQGPFAGSPDGRGRSFATGSNRRAPFAARGVETLGGLLSLEQSSVTQRPRGPGTGEVLLRSGTMRGSSEDPELENGDGLEVPDWGSLVVRIQNGDATALEQLYSFFAKGVRYFFLRALGPEELDDRVHDCFVIVTEALRAGELREPARLMGYIRTVVRRQIAAIIQESISKRRTHVDFADSLFTIADWKEDPEKSVASKQREAIGRKVLKEISDRDREVLMRFYVHEQSYETICQDMGLTYNQFRLLKSRAKARFGKLGRRITDAFGGR